MAYAPRKAAAAAEQLLAVISEKNPELKPDTNTVKAKPVKEKDTNFVSFREYIDNVGNSKWFNGGIAGVIFFNAIIILWETNESSKAADLDQVSFNIFFQAVDMVLMAIYTIEFLVKVYASPSEYFKNSRLDFFIFFASYAELIINESNKGSNIPISFLRVIRAIRGARVLRSISFSRPLLVLMRAIAATTSALNILGLIFLFQFIFSMMGIYFFILSDDAPDGAKYYWKDTGEAIFALWTYVTADGWIEVYDSTVDSTDASSYLVVWYTLFFMFVCHFMFTNLFIGVIIQSVEEATTADRNETIQRQMKVINEKKKLLAQRQEAEMRKLLLTKSHSPNKTFQEIIEMTAGNLQRDDITIIRSMYTDIRWAQTYAVSLKYREKSVYQIQQLQIELATTLAKLLDSKASKRC